jgi:hypothetical protein
LRVTIQSIPEPLRSLLGYAFDVELFWHSFPSLLLAELQRDPAQARLFKQQFADAIVRETISPEQYRELTHDEYETAEKLNSWLRRLWVEIYGDEPIPGDD